MIASDQLNHKGQILKDVFIKENINIAKLAKTLNVNRGTIYFWFTKPDIAKEKFYEIGYVINYDFGPILRQVQ
ncbi:hypothetical protein [Mucilaginibacter myungsuensis]|uniref:Uncharacterized protein n=1 Tax=Mucilaginibacter myungsuensis TaxID=649104 RepID=A0A929KTB0_9SPHI|nr:hypothetical protein [Mucilaginibacter myungsuensis]MBE9660407.1 hypothetical protein [Mucilaginibacter myungsuensis]MDN3600450.1 hypothetical protein [Mucilaginibacter myungsuensis]